MSMLVFSSLIARRLHFTSLLWWHLLLLSFSNNDWRILLFLTLCQSLTPFTSIQAWKLDRRAAFFQSPCSRIYSSSIFSCGRMISCETKNLMISFQPKHHLHLQCCLRFLPCWRNYSMKVLQRWWFNGIHFNDSQDLYAVHFFFNSL